MCIESTINGFYSSVKKAGDLLSNYCNEIDDKQEKIKACISGISPESESGFDSENEIDVMCKKQVFQYNKAISAWQKTVKKYIDGKEFVNKFEKSLLMIVFADVNAGKSSLGNFVSGYSFKDTPYGRLYSKPKCYSYDYADKTLDCRSSCAGNVKYSIFYAVQRADLGGYTWHSFPIRRIRTAR